MTPVDLRWREVVPAIPGWHQDWLASLIAEGERIRKLSEPGFTGFMNALYSLRASIMPPAYMRAKETEQFQHGIERAIAELRKHETQHLGEGT
jgi:hypothetical protein